jgi:flagellar basal body rod protein FlgG
LEIARNGKVGYRDSSRSWIELGKLDVVEPESLAGLQKFGDSLYRTSRPTRPAGPDVAVRQGFLEASGTNPILEMTEMIETSRAFEANVNMIKYQDEALGQLLQSVSRR